MQRHTDNIHGNKLPTIKNNSTYNHPPLVMTQRKCCDTPLPSLIKQSHTNLACHTTEEQINSLKIIHKNKDEKHALENLGYSFWGVVTSVVHSFRT
jgi:hypothetical protein